MTYLTFGPRPVPAWNEEVTRSHAGEDGPCWKVERTREQFIDEQYSIADFAEWAVWELVGEDCGPDEDLTDEFPRGEFPILGENYFPHGACWEDVDPFHGI
jgi:hypothetical protein